MPNCEYFMKLDQFLKLKGWVASGGEAKHLIQQGLVLVNGLVETRRGRQLCSTDHVRLGPEGAFVEGTDSAGP